MANSGGRYKEGKHGLYRESERIWTLDLLRAIAVLAVLFFHCLPIRGSGRFESIAQSILGSMWWGVDLFFVLSGYLITTVLLKIRAAPHPLQTFLTARCLRIFPLYFSWLAIFFAVDALAPRPQVQQLFAHLPYLLTYTTNVWIALHQKWFSVDLLDHLWSLAVEEQFYLLWPFAVLWLRRRALVLLTIVAILFAQLLKLLILVTHFSWEVGYTSVFTRADALLGGALASYAVLWWRDRTWLAPLAATLLIAAMIALAGIAYWKSGLFLQPVPVALGTSAWAWFFSSGLVLMLRRNRDLRPPSALRRAVTAIATLSYGMYLSHWIIWRWLCQYSPHFEELPPTYQFLIAVGATFLVSALLYALVERPFLILKQRLSTRAAK